MKKLLALLIALVFVFSFAACGAKDEGETTAPAGADTSAADAEKAVTDFFNNLDAKKLIQNSGEDTSVFGDEEDFALAIFDASILNSDYKINSSEKLNDTTVIVKITLTTPKFDEKFEEVFINKIDAAKEPENDDEALDIVAQVIIDSFSDPSINTRTVPVSLTVKLVNGAWAVETTAELFNALTESSLYVFQAFANMK